MTSQVGDTANPSAPREPLIGFTDVSKYFFKGAPLEVLRRVSVTIGRGEFVSLVGPSGCGKSTLLNMTAGILKPSIGSVTYDGQPVSGINTRVGYMTQRDNLLPWRNVHDNVAIALEVRGQTSRAEKRSLIAQQIAAVGLTGFENHYPAELSGGMRKRVSIARTMIYSPETLLMDEPFGALDAQLKLILQAELLRVWDATHKTVLFVTHDLSEAIALSDRIVVFSARPGRIKAEYHVDLPRPRDPFTIRFTDGFRELHESIWEELKTEVMLGTDV